MIGAGMMRKTPGKNNKRARTRTCASKSVSSRAVRNLRRADTKKGISLDPVAAKSLRLSKSRAKFFKSASLLVSVLHDKGLIPSKTARALYRSLEQSVTRRPEGFSLASSANLCDKVTKLIANTSLGDRDKRHREMDSLETISRFISSSVRNERVPEKCLTVLRDLIPFQNGAIFILREDTGKLELEVALGHPQDLIESVKFDLGQGLSAWAAREKKSVLVRELSRPEKDGLERLGSFLAVPIVAGARSIGVITMGHPKSGAFISDHRRILQLFCTLISGFILSSIAEKEQAALAVV